MNVEQVLQSAVQLHQTGRVAEAQKLYYQILAHDPKNADALHLLGVAAIQARQCQTAVDLIRRAIAIEPEDAFFYGSLGNAFQDLGKLDEAIAALRKAIELMPELAEAHNNLGAVLKQAGQIDDAIACYRQAIRLRPQEARAHGNLADALRLSGKLDDAIASYREAVRLAPNYVEAHINLGNTLKDIKKIAESIDCYRIAIRLAPNSAEIHINLATALRDIGQLDEAITVNQTAIRLRPDIPEAHANLANAFRDEGLLDQAIAAYRQALKLNPALARAHTALLFTLNDLPAITPETLWAEHRAWAARHASPIAIPPHENDRSPDRPLRIGYVSSDFRRHSVGYFFLPLLQHHNQQNFQVFCYAHQLLRDEVTEQIQKSCHQWRNISRLTDAAADQLIRADAIDILIDLSGHSAGNRLSLFARKPAPIQVTYLGYPNTTGMTAIDYRLTDARADPPGTTDHLYSEKLYRLPQCAWCYQPPHDAPPIEPRPENSPITFGSFNAFSKINPQLIELWAAVLRQIPASRLLLKSAGAGEPSSRERLTRQFASLGIPADRIETRGRTKHERDHLQQYNHVDIALDTYPYHGTTTTCEALWMGVPVVTLAGQTHLSRVGVSLLTTAGLPDLIAQSPDQFISIAAALANNPARLATLRQSLRNQLLSCPLTNAPAFAANVEAAYRQMWHTWCSR